jgi:hypothetical protein
VHVRQPGRSHGDLKQQRRQQTQQQQEGLQEELEKGVDLFAEVDGAKIRRRLERLLEQKQRDRSNVQVR